MENKIYHLDSASKDRDNKAYEQKSLLTTIKKNFNLFGQGDKSLTIIVGLLLVISMLAVFSATMVADQNPLGFLQKQLFSMLIGSLLIIFIRLIPNRWFTNIRLINILNAIVTLLILYSTFFGQEGGGASSWISYAGVYFQPSEVFKIMMILTWSRFLLNFNRTILLTREKSKFWMYTFPFILMVLSSLFILVQPDIGTAFIVGFVVVGLMMMFQFTKKTNRIVTFLFSLFMGGLYLFSKYFADGLVSSGYHFFERLGSFVNPYNYQLGTGYQVIQSYKAIANGGFWGVGLGQGVVKSVLPAAHTDFILSVIAEETGLIGVSVVIILLLALIFHILRLASRMNRRFHRISTTGFAILLLIQSFINIGGLSGMIPLTGVTLPFISYGGTSMMVNLIIIGIIQKFIAEEKTMNALHYKVSKNSVAKGGF